MHAYVSKLAKLTEQLKETKQLCDKSGRQPTNEEILDGLIGLSEGLTESLHFVLINMSR